MHLEKISLLLLATLLGASNAVASPSTPDLAARIDAQMDSNRERYGIAGQAVLIAHNGTVVHQRADGMRDVESRTPVAMDTVFPVQSLAKLFTSTLLMQLVDAGKVSLDAPTSRYVPSLPAAWQSILVRDFLNHSSGVPEYFEVRDGQFVSPGSRSLPSTLAEAINAVGDTPVYFTPGSQNRYTQTNFLVLTALLEAHYKQPYDVIARERLIEPLGLHNTWLGSSGVPAARHARLYTGVSGVLQPADEPSFPSYSHGHADLQTTVGDMHRFLQALARGEVVRVTTLEKLWQPYRLSGGRTSFMSSGWDTVRRDGYTHVGHDGGARLRVRLAYKDRLENDPWVFIYFTNGSASNVWSSTLVDSMMAAAAPETFPGATQDCCPEQP